MSASEDITGLERSTVADTTLLVRAGSADHTIMLLHGIGSRAFSFARLMRAWPAGPRLIAWDAPGYGTSAALKSVWPQARDYAARLAAVCDGLEAKRVHVVGHSLGCLVAGAFGRHVPQRCGRIALLSPALGYKIDQASGTLPVAHAARIAELETLGSTAFAQRRAPRLVYDALHHPDVVARVTEAMSTVALPGYAQAVRMLACGDLLADAADIAAAATVVTGTEDVVTPPDNARRLAAVLQSRAADAFEAHMIAGAGHAVYLEAPEAVGSRLSVFFARAP